MAFCRSGRLQIELLDPAEFDFQVLDSPEALRRVIVEKNKVNNKSRLVAGYCWPWNSKRNLREMDVVVPEHAFEMQWNLASDSSLWIVSPNSVNQINCIHTSQGLEVDYIGVIVGPDLIVRNGSIVTRPEKRASSDRSIRGYKKLLKLDPEGARARIDSIIKNTYRTLMTRGMKGCYVYFTDAETANYFRSLISNVVPLPSATKDHPIGMPDVPLRRLHREEVRPYENCVPLVDLKLAAGAFSETQVFDTADFDWVELPDHFRPQQDLFVAQVVGESMNRRIKNGSWCLFRLNPKGTRQGKVVVAQHRDIHDPEFGGSFTVKVYQSDKVPAKEGGWTHQRVMLKPDSDDAQFRELIFDKKSAERLRIVAELLAVIG